MVGSKKETAADSRPRLRVGMRVAEFTNYYWLKTDLVAFARKLGLPTHGSKPELSTRIERRLEGQPDRLPAKRPRMKRARDSDKPLRRETPVGVYKSDAKTRAFFELQIGPEFHFTYRLNQFRLSRDGLTYGDLVDEWLAERDRRCTDGYKAPLAEHGKYNRYVRDFFADEANKGKSMRDAANSWNAVKNTKGDQKYRPQKK